MNMAGYCGEAVDASTKSFQFSLFSVGIFSRHWQRALTFYRDVIGLPLHLINEHEQRAIFGLGAARLVVEAVCDADKDHFDGYSTGISIETNSFKRTYNDLIERDVEFIGLPEINPDGRVFAEFYDPDGNILTLLGPVNE